MVRVKSGFSWGLMSLDYLVCRALGSSGLCFHPQTFTEKISVPWSLVSSLQSRTGTKKIHGRYGICSPSSRVGINESVEPGLEEVSYSFQLSYWLESEGYRVLTYFVMLTKFCFQISRRKSCKSNFKNEWKVCSVYC